MAKTDKCLHCGHERQEHKQGFCFVATAIHRAGGGHMGTCRCPGFEVDNGRFQGKIQEIKSLTPTGMQVLLDNGVTISVGFNKGYVHMSFSGIAFEADALQIQEAKNVGVDLPLANIINIDYKRNPNNRT